VTPSGLTSMLTVSPFQDGGRAALLRVARCAVDEMPFRSADLGEWHRLPFDADSQHLAPLLEWLAGGPDSSVPEPARTQLRALVLRQAAWHRARTAAASEILDALEQCSIRTLVLKGGALAWTIYPSPALRPMADIDLLVDQPQAARAQAVIRELGFTAQAARRFGRFAHHLPVASRTDGGLPINVELHIDALTRDSGASISLANLAEPPRCFTLNDRVRLTLGYVDMLRHLVHHMLEPSPDGYIRLISVVDLLRYARTFHRRIDWPRLEAEFPFVPNALHCVHAVVPLSGELSRYAAPGWWRPEDAGKTIRPLRWMVRRGSPFAVARELFSAPAWWMHAYYNVQPGGSLRPVRLVRHPARVIRWLSVRIGGF
jgi:hypothetical protein